MFDYYKWYFIIILVCILLAAINFKAFVVASFSYLIVKEASK